jgi:hypothetical protein
MRPAGAYVRELGGARRVGVEERQDGDDASPQLGLRRPLAKWERAKWERG